MQKRIQYFLPHAVLFVKKSSMDNSNFSYQEGTAFLGAIFEEQPTFPGILLEEGPTSPSVLFQEESAFQDIHFPEELLSKPDYFDFSQQVLDDILQPVQTGYTPPLVAAGVQPQYTQLMPPGISQTVPPTYTQPLSAASVLPQQLDTQQHVFAADTLPQSAVTTQPVSADTTQSVITTSLSAQPAADSTLNQTLQNAVTEIQQHFLNNCQITSDHRVLGYDASFAKYLMQSYLPASDLYSITRRDNSNARDLSRQSQIPDSVRSALLSASKAVHPQTRLQPEDLANVGTYDESAALTVLLKAHIQATPPGSTRCPTLANTYVQNEFAASIVVKFVALGQIPYAEDRQTAGPMVASGHVYVYKQGGPIRRWTDSHRWTPSRKGKSASVNIYRECKILSKAELRQAAATVTIKRRKAAPSTSGEIKKRKLQEANLAGKSAAIKHVPVTLDNCEKLLFVTPLELAFGALDMTTAADELVGPLTHCNDLLVHGLVKRTFKVDYMGQAYTVVNYYNISDVLGSVILPLNFRR
ncbi:MAG: Global transcription regulator sge1 [Sporothrix thermara]